MQLPPEARSQRLGKGRGPRARRWRACPPNRRGRARSPCHGPRARGDTRRSRAPTRLLWWVAIADLALAPGPARTEPGGSELEVGGRLNGHSYSKPSVGRAAASGGARTGRSMQARSPTGLGGWNRCEDAPIGARQRVAHPTPVDRKHRFISSAHARPPRLESGWAQRRRWAAGRAGGGREQTRARDPIRVSRSRRIPAVAATRCARRMIAAIRQRAGVEADSQIRSRLRSPMPAAPPERCESRSLAQGPRTPW